MFPPTDDFTEELLNLHEAEVLTLKKHYEEHKELFEGVTKWQENWALFLELDVSPVHTNVFTYKRTPRGHKCDPPHSAGTNMTFTVVTFLWIPVSTAEKGQRPLSVQQPRWKPSERGEAEK